MTYLTHVSKIQILIMFTVLEHTGKAGQVKNLTIWTRRPSTPDPLDVSDFSKVIKMPSFVDKSMLIKDFFEGNLRILITAPHEFGKSTNLDMLRRFLSSTKVPTENESSSKRILSRNCRIFKKYKLNIYEDKEFFYQHCGQYPVLYVNFVDIIVYDKEELFVSIKHIINSAFRYHDYMIESTEHEVWNWTSDQMQGHDINKFLKYWDEIRCLFLSENEIKKSLFYLSEVLHTYHNKKAIVLVDEFDSVWLKCIDQVDSKLTLSSGIFNRIMFVLLSSNTHIHRVMLVSCMKYGPLLTLEKIKSVQIYEFSHDHRYAKYFGLTTNEVKYLLEKFKAPHKLSDVRIWYNGFTVPQQNLSLYNTWSVTHYLETGILKPYGYSFNYIHNIGKLVKLTFIRHYLLKLALGVAVPIQMYPGHSHLNRSNYMYDMRTILGHPKQIWRMDQHWNDFLLYLYECKIVSAAKYVKASSEMKVIIPNHEAVQSLFMQLYNIKFYDVHYKFKQSRMFKFLDCFNGLGKVAEDTVKMFLYFSQTLAKLYTFSRLPDDTYAFGFSFYYLLRLTKLYTIVNVELSKFVFYRTRSVFVTVIRDDGTAIILEPRYANLDSAEVALNDIIVNEYYKVLDQRSDFRDLVTSSRFYIGIYLDEKKYVEICYLVNSTDLNEKRCISNAMNLGLPTNVVAQIQSFKHFLISSNSSKDTVFYLPSNWKGLELMGPNSTGLNNTIARNTTYLIL